MIDVLVPVLGRPQNARPLVESFRAHSDPLDEITFLCSPGDSKQIVGLHGDRGADADLMDFPPGPGDYARKMNYGYSMTETTVDLPRSRRHHLHGGLVGDRAKQDALRDRYQR